jgi:hypothetical protein
MTDNDAELRFDRASYAKDAGSGLPCANCKGPLGDAYWKWQNHIVCGACRDGLQTTFAESQSNARLGKAVLWAAGTALGCGIAYAAFVAMTNVQFALATIGIAFLVARVVRKASGGIGGVRFQIVAVGFTYLAATMGYLPGIWSGMKEASSEHDKSQAAAGATSPDTTSPTTGADGRAADADSKASPLDLVVALAFLFGIMLAAPFLELTSAPIGFLIVVFGLWEAWKLSRAPPLRIEGPFRVGAAEEQPPA